MDREGKKVADGGWIPVINKHKKVYGNGSNEIKEPLFTLFVDNLPNEADQTWLRNIFNQYGVVKDSYIPLKRSKRGSKFGFVRYNCDVSTGVAIYRANGT